MQQAKNGVLLCTQENFPLDATEWDQLNSIANDSSIPRETVEMGDGGEMTSLNVIRFIIDKENGPVFVNEEYSRRVAAILESEKMMKFLKKLSNKEQLYIRRCQVNCMYQNSYIGVHEDRENHPDYYMTVVLHFNCDYEGGEFAYYDDEGNRHICDVENNSAVISLGFVPHEVLRVKKNKRNTLAFFLSEQPKRDY